MAEVFRPCAVIPVFNHHQKLAGVISALRLHGLHCILVDDGSNSETKAALHQLAKEPYITAWQLSWNQGKGTAVMEGLMRAQQAGFSHAIQIDADGQHDTTVLPELLATARTHPGALITGQPVYDDSIPKSRLYGRKFSHVCVCIETLWAHAPDAMIGFRVYPLTATCRLIQNTDITRRMDFDTDIMVRLRWAGVAIKAVPVRITYPEDGLSHFDALHDTLRIIYLHTRLLFAMPGHLPQLLRGHTDQQDWHQLQERGSTLGINILLSAYRVLGQRAFRTLLLPVTTYFFLTGKTARQASRDYLHRLYQVAPQSLPRKPDRWLSFQHFMSFADALTDRFVACLGQISLNRLDIVGNDLVLEKLKRNNKGVVFLTSHLGNIDLCRALVSLGDIQRPTPVNVLVHTHHAGAFHRVLAKAHPDTQLRLIPVDTIGPDTAIALSEMIARGEIVAIAADRIPINSKQSNITSAQFLGASARFPKGPLVLASILECPVFTVFCTRQRKNRFLLTIELFADPLVLPEKQRQEQIATYAQNYADRLEAVCKQAPLEWFNFFDYWSKSGAQH